MLELAGILVLGVFAQWVAARLGFPAILPLILIGLAAGPIASLIDPDGLKFIDPRRIFHQDMMGNIVGICVGVILFEGGMTLKLQDLRSVRSTVRNLALIGPFISMFGGGFIAHYVLGLEWSVALLFGALIIVTGPTVVMPILRAVHPTKKSATVLQWEGILTDPVGALFAVIVYEFLVIAGPGLSFDPAAFGLFAKTIGIGLSWGIGCGLAMIFLLRQNLIPEFLINVVALGFVVLCYSGSDIMAHESGLISATIMGMILTNSKAPDIDKILHFKETLVILLISVLFIILSANINIEQLELLGSKSLIVLALVVLVLRPISVAICSLGSDLSWREKIFISFVGPRGIVAAAVASVFSLQILENPSTTDAIRADAELLIPLTFLIILGTVILVGSFAKPLAKALGVVIKHPNGVLILGATKPARLISQYLNSHNVHCVLVDTSESNNNEAKALGLEVINKNILSDDLFDDVNLLDIGNFFGMSSNNELNILALRKFRSELGEEKVFRLVTSRENQYETLPQPQYLLFKKGLNHNMMMAITEKFPSIQEIEIKSQEHFQSLNKNLNGNFFPVFIRTADNRIRLFRAHKTPEINPGDFMVYIGETPKT